MGAKQNVKQAANNNDTNDEIGKVPVAPEAPPFNFDVVLSTAERDVEAAFAALLLFIASQSTMDADSRDFVIHRLAYVLTSEGKAPRASDDPSDSALNKRLRRLFGNKGVLTICNLSRAAIGNPPILG